MTDEAKRLLITAIEQFAPAVSASATTSSSASALGRDPLPTQSATTFIFRIISTGPATLLCDAANPPADIRDFHRTIIAQVKVSSNNVSIEDVNLSFTRYHFSDGFPALLDEILVKYWDATDTQDELRLLGQDYTGKITIPAGLDFKNRGFYKARFFAYAKLPGEAALGHEVDPLVIIVPRRP